MTNAKKIVDQLDELSPVEFMRVVGEAAGHRFNKMRQHTSRASFFYEISTICRRAGKVLK